MLTKIITPVLAMVATLMGAVAATPIAASADKRDEQAALKSGRITYYNPGTGACGQTHTDADFVVALSKYDFDPYTPDGNPNHNTLCGKYIRVSYNGKTVDVMVVDRCEGCNSGDIDLSPAAFRKSFLWLPSFHSCPLGEITWLTGCVCTEVLADLSVGVVQGSWDWI
jgi:expansin (peptidoglycan-binding protein)